MTQFDRAVPEAYLQCEMQTAQNLHCIQLSFYLVTRIQCTTGHWSWSGVLVQGKPRRSRSKACATIAC